MKIAIVAYSLHGKTGAGRIIYEHAKFLANKGFGVDILAHKKKYFSPIEQVKIKRTPFWFIRDKKRRDRFDNWVKKEVSGVYDFVISHGHPHIGDLCFVHNLNDRVRSELTGHEALYPNYGGGENKWACHKVVANSEMVRLDLISRYGFAPTRIELLLPALNPTLFSSDNKTHLSSFRKQHQIPTDGFVVALICSGELEKRGFPSFLKVAEILKSKIPNLWLLVIGNDRKPQKIRSALQEAMGNDHFTYIPTTSKIEEAFATTDVMIHPAAYEEFGMVVSEALACGTPVVTNENVGASSLIAAVDQELVVQSMRDIDQMATAVLKIYHDPARYEAVFRELSIEVRNMLTWEKHCEELVQLIEKCKN